MVLNTHLPFVTRFEMFFPSLFVARHCIFFLNSDYLPKPCKGHAGFAILLFNLLEDVVSNILNQLHSVEALQEVLEESKAHPVLLFKHSNACPISSRAYHQFQDYLESADPNVTYHLITVQTDRPVSNEVESRLGLLHESPQAILIRDGREIWNASHSGITVSSLQSAIQKAQSK
jgi:bacillithiol system protein YtxJ